MQHGQALGAFARCSDRTKLEAKQLQQATKLVDHGSPCRDQLSPNANGGTVEMHGQRLHVDALEPACPSHLGEPLGVMNIAFVNPRGQHAFGVTCGFRGDPGHYSEMIPAGIPR